MVRDEVEEHFGALIDRHAQMISSGYFSYISNAIVGGINDEVAERYAIFRSGINPFRVNRLDAFESISMIDLMKKEDCGDGEEFVQRIMENFDPNFFYRHPIEEKVNPARALHDIWRYVRIMSKVDEQKDREEGVLRVADRINALGRFLGFDEMTFHRLDMADWQASRTPQQIADDERDLARIRLDIDQNGPAF